MTRVALVVTGDLERLALHTSLKRAFPGVRFDVHKVYAITSATIAAPPNPRMLVEGSAAWRLVERLWKLVTSPTAPGEAPADFAFAVDDVELLNLPPHGQPANIAGLVHQVTNAFLQARFPNAQARERHAEAMRTRCAFHLVCPMIEAYFFGESDALRRAGVPDSRTPSRRPGDLEDFLAVDPSYASPASPAWQAVRASRAKANLNPDAHPKDYLGFLKDPVRNTYDETQDGVAALASLDWPTLATSTTQIQLLRAFFEDLSDALNVPNPLGTGPPHPATFPTRTTRRETLALRNL